MRRENRRRAESWFDFKKTLYISVSILAMAIIGFVITFFVYGNKLEENTKLAKINSGIIGNHIENTETTSSQFGKTVNEVVNENTVNETKYAVNTSQVENRVTEGNSNSSKNTKTNTTKDSKANTTNTTNTTKTEEKTKDPTFKKPVTGEIIKEFAKDKLVYSNTLGEWVTHTGIDIKANKTTVVKASAEGVIKSIKNDLR